MAIVDNQTFAELKETVFNDIASFFLVTQINDTIFQGDGKAYSFHTFFNRSLRIASANLLLNDLEEDLINYEHNLVYADYRGDCSELCLRWQNRVYWTQEKVKQYEHFENAKWRSGGLFHPNCRHTVDLFYEDLKDDLIVDNTDNYDKIRVEAEKEAKMRYNERQIRKWEERKAKSTIYNNPFELDKANKKLKEYKKRSHNKFRVNDYYNVF